MRLSVLGCGRWGTFLAWYLGEQLPHEVTLWGRPGSSNLARLRETGKNDWLEIGRKIRLTDQLDEAVRSAACIVISISAQNLRSLAQELAHLPMEGKTVVLCMKGIEEGSGKRLTEIMEEYLPQSCPVAVWVGPGHVQDFVRGIPNCMVIDSKSSEVKKFLIESFSSDLIRFYYGTDLIGTEVGAASKNVIGIAAGILDGLSRSSLKGALMSRGTREVARLIGAMGGNELSAYGLCHLGDYEATVFSPYSHNRAYGEEVARHGHYEKLAEGVSTTTAVLQLGERYHVDLPICRAVSDIIHRGKEPKSVLMELFLRSLKEEFPQ